MSLDQDFRNLLDEGVVADLSDRAKFRLTGADRVRYLNGQVTNDVTLLRRAGAQGPQAIYSCVTNAKGKLEADVFITELGEEEERAFLLDADAALRDELFARLDKYIIADDVRLEDVTESFALFHVFGKTGDPAARLAARLGGVPGIVFRSSAQRFGFSGIDIVAPRAQYAALAGKLPAPLSAASLDLIRVARGIPKWGAELTPDVLPPEAGLDERAVSYTKGCYIGQEIISRIKSAGRVNKQLVSLTQACSPESINSLGSLAPGMILYANPNPSEAPGKIGTLTSCAVDPALKMTFALGYVKTAYAIPGTLIYAGNDAGCLSRALEIKNFPLISEAITS